MRPLLSAALLAASVALLMGCATAPTEGTYEVGYNLGYFAGVADEARRQDRAKKPLSFSDLQPYMTDEELACNKMDACFVNLEAVEKRRLHWNDKIIDGRVKGEARDVGRIDWSKTDLGGRFEALADQAAKKTDAQFCAKATEEWQRRAFCHGEKIIDGRVKR